MVSTLDDIERFDQPTRVGPEFWQEPFMEGISRSDALIWFIGFLFLFTHVPSW